MSGDSQTFIFAKDTIREYVGMPNMYVGYSFDPLRDDKFEYC